MAGIGKNICSLRKERQLSQAELGKVLGYSQRAISDWEKDVCEPNIETMKKMVKFFNITFDELFDE